MPDRDVLRPGPARIVVIGGGKDAARFLSDAGRAGADLALITATDTDHPKGVHVHRVPRLGPLHVVRALDALRQIRPIDQLVLASAWLPPWLMPKNARGLVAPVHLRGTEAAELVNRLTRVRAG
jgi:hypothetical protein